MKRHNKTTNNKYIIYNMYYSIYIYILYYITTLLYILYIYSIYTILLYYIYIYIYIYMCVCVLIRLLMSTFLFAFARRPLLDGGGGTLLDGLVLQGFIRRPRRPKIVSNEMTLASAHGASGAAAEPMSQHLTSLGSTMPREFVFVDESVFGGSTTKQYCPALAALMRRSVCVIAFDAYGNARELGGPCPPPAAAAGHT